VNLTQTVANQLGTNFQTALAGQLGIPKGQVVVYTFAGYVVVPVFRRLRLLLSLKEDSQRRLVTSAVVEFGITYPNTPSDQADIVYDNAVKALNNSVNTGALTTAFIATDPVLLANTTVSGFAPGSPSFETNPPVYPAFTVTTVAFNQIIQGTPPYNLGPAPENATVTRRQLATTPPSQQCATYCQQTIGLSLPFYFSVFINDTSFYCTCSQTLGQYVAYTGGITFLASDAELVSTAASGLAPSFRKGS